MRNASFLLAIGAGSLLAFSQQPSAWANGTETLGSPDITIQSGSHIIAAGTGLYTQPGTIQLTVPAGATIKQVLLYWDGASYLGTAPDATIRVNGVDVTGTQVGGPITFINQPAGQAAYATFRADITRLGFVTTGANTLTVTGLDNNFANDGAGILVILQDASPVSSIGLRDGLDVAWAGYTGDMSVTQPQTFNFPAAAEARTATLTLFVGSVGQNRPNQILLTVNGQLTTLNNPLFDNSGEQWDALTLAVEVPAGADSVTVQLVSVPPESGASLAWDLAALSVPGVPAQVPPAQAGPGTLTQGFWKNHPDAWPSDTIELGGVTYTKAQAIAILQEPSRGDKTIDLAHQLIAAKLNVAIGNDSSCVSQAMADADAFLAAHPIGSNVAARSDAWKSIDSAFSHLGNYNEGKLCVPHQGKDENDEEDNSSDNATGKVTPPAANPGSNPPAASPGSGFVAVGKHGKKLHLDWKGKLESADDLNGPWAPVTNANPVEVPMDGKIRFYRVR